MPLFSSDLYYFEILNFVMKKIEWDTIYPVFSNAGYRNLRLDYTTRFKLP